MSQTGPPPTCRKPGGGISVQINQLEICGFTNASSGICNFLGIPFAEIPARFRQARLIDPRKESGVLDATRYGPRCPQPPDSSRELRQHLYTGVEPSASSPFAEFSCLTLNIYAPADAVASSFSARLPVLVFIHGGGWLLGDGNSDYDGNFLIRYSVDIGKPFVYVTLNYRVGYFGFLASRELKDEALRLGEVGFANQGLYDQRLGLQWVQNNIHFFGGDGYRVTLAGQSAGAWSVLAHLRSNFPACQQALIMSCPILPPMSEEMAQASFDRLVASVGLSASAPASAKLAALRSLTAEQMVERVEAPIGRPIWDSEWFVDLDPSASLSQVGNFPSWLKRIVIGTTKQEFALLLPMWASKTATEITTAIEAVIKDVHFAEEIMDAYGIRQESDNDTALHGLMAFGQDSIMPSVLPAIADRASPEVFVYSFDQGDDFESSFFKGYAYHSLDSVFFTRFPAVAGERASAGMRATADAFNQACAKLVYGERPWETYQIAGRVMSFDGDRSGLSEMPIRWSRFTSSKERQKLFYTAGEDLLSYNR